MEGFKPTLCSICLNVISDKTFRVIEETTKNVLDALLLKGTIEVNKSLVCDTCWTKVFELFRFKSICINIENCIFPYIDSENGVPVDLKQIYVKERADKQLRGLLEDERICRLCMRIVTSGVTAVKDLETDLICQYIPEVNFYSIKDPVICAACLECLKTHSGFLRNCFAVQKFENICEDEVMDNQLYIKSEEIEIKTEENFEETETPFSVYNWKSEDMEELKTEPMVAQVDDCNPYGHQSDKELHFLHPQLQHEKISEIYKCHTCNYETRYKQCLSVHQLKHRDASEIQMYKCDTCNFETKSKKCLVRHQLLQKECSEIQQMYNCDTCSYETRYKRALVTHQLTHKDVSEVQMYPSEVEMFKCGTCNFETKKYLGRHQQLHKECSEIQMYKCELCDFETRYTGSVLSHRLIHKDASEVKMYKCDTCSFETKRKKYLGRHQRLHKESSEIQMYKCDTCDFETRYTGSLVSHRLIHKDASEVELYKCESCNFQTKLRKNLKLHQLTHKESSEIQMYKCDTCSYESRYKRGLVRHQLKHKDLSEVQMYKCNMCNYGTKYSVDLKRHQLTHGSSSQMPI